MIKTSRGSNHCVPSNAKSENTQDSSIQASAFDESNVNNIRRNGLPQQKNAKSGIRQQYDYSQASADSNNKPKTSREIGNHSSYQTQTANTMNSGSNSQSGMSSLSSGAPKHPGLGKKLIYALSL